MDSPTKVPVTSTLPTMSAQISFHFQANVELPSTFRKSGVVDGFRCFYDLGVGEILQGIVLKKGLSTAELYTQR
jgi:hypothetical protein